MRRARAGLLRFRNLFRRDHLERELADELDTHVQMHTNDNIRAGMAPDEARRQAILALGGIEQTKERYRDRRAVPLLEMFLQDLRFGVRTLRKNPAFALGAVGALTIGMGANVIIFSIANALILRPLPAANPEQLVRAYTGGFSNTSYAEYLEYRDRNQTLSGLAAFQGVSLVLRSDGPAEHIPGVAVSGNYFETLGVSTAYGRAIAPEDDRLGAAGVVVLSHAYWRRRFGGDPTVVGRAIGINGHPFTVIGVATSTFTGTQSPVTVEAWVPWNAPTLAPTTEQLAQGGGRPAHLIGRLLPGVTLALAQADLATVATRMASPGSNRARSLALYPARTLLPQMANMVGTFVGLLTGVAALVLLVACVNIAGLLLARAEVRRREIAVRLALGAGRRRLIAQSLTESLLLASCAAVVASGFAVLVGRMMARVSLPVAEPIALDLAFDSRVMVFTVGLSLLTTMLFGLVPAAQSSRMDVLPGLRDAATATVGRRRTWVRRALITTQVALSTLLLIVAGVLVRSMVSARSVDIGFSPQHILTASIDLSALSYTRERGSDLFDRLLARLDQDTRLADASLVGTVPLTVSMQAFGFVKEGATPPEPNQRVPPVFFDSVSPGYFRTVGMPLLAGRDFVPDDHAGAPPVAIVNETLADRFWPGENPVGKRLVPLGPRNSLGPSIEVVGLTRNAKYATVGEDSKMFMYRPLPQQYTSRVTLLVKTPSDPMAALPFVRAAIQDLDPDVALFRVGTLEDATRVSLLPVQVAATSAGALGVVVLGLAALGIYAMMSYLVRQRRREVGIRLALGAEPAQVVRALTRDGLRWTTLGLALGLTASLAATHLLRSLLYGISATDPVAFIAIPALLALTAYVACRAPVAAASRVDPLLVLRDE